MIPSPEKITKEWLEDVLKTQIRQIAARGNPAFNSSITHLEVTYAAEVSLPRKLLVKGNMGHEGQNEIQFYRFAQNLDLPMIPRTLGLGYDLQNGRSFLILEDISETHAAPVTREQLKALNGVPTNVQMTAIVDSIAHFHAVFWEQSQFDAIPNTTEMRWWYRDEAHHTRHVARRKREWARFIELYQDELPDEWLAVGESALEMLPNLFEGRIKPRIKSKRALSMSHGDCYLSQFLVPRAGAGKTYLIDFQDASVNFPAYDLVNMLASFWTRQQRAAYEAALLCRYQRELSRRGVQYSLEQLHDDYRLSLSYMLFDAVWNAISGSSRDYWKPKMRCLVEAYQDWHCAELSICETPFTL